MKIGVSGLSGFIGSAIKAQVSSDLELVEVSSFSRISASSISNEIDNLVDSGVRNFLHLAWPASSLDGDYRTSKRNFDALEKTLAVKRACEKSGLKFYGLGTGIDRMIDVESSYSIAKFAVRQVFLDDIQHERISWIRPHYVFDELAWPRFLNSDPSTPIQIRNNTPRDFIHIKDVASGILAIVTQGMLGEVDLGAGKARSPSELCIALGRRWSIAEKLSPEADSGISEIVASQSQLLNDLWKAEVTNTIFGEEDGI